MIYTEKYFSTDEVSCHLILISSVLKIKSVLIYGKRECETKRKRSSILP